MTYHLLPLATAVLNVIGESKSVANPATSGCDLYPGKWQQKRKKKKGSYCNEETPSVKMANDIPGGSNVDLPDYVIFGFVFIVLILLFYIERLS